MNSVQTHFVQEASHFVCFALSCTHLRRFVDAFTQDPAPSAHHQVYDDVEGLLPYSDNETITESITEPGSVPS